LGGDPSQGCVCPCCWNSSFAALVLGVDDVDGDEVRVGRVKVHHGVRRRTRVGDGLRTRWISVTHRQAAAYCHGHALGGDPSQGCVCPCCWNSSFAALVLGVDDVDGDEVLTRCEGPLIRWHLLRDDPVAAGAGIDVASRPALVDGLAVGAGSPIQPSSTVAGTEAVVELVRGVRADGISAAAQ